jgi:hypothetical protein
MSIETNTSIYENKPEAKHLYPERASYSAEKNLKEILEYLSGDKEKEVLTDEEKLDLIAFEQPFVDKLAEAYSISPETKTLYSEYFDTPKGQEELQQAILSLYLANKGLPETQIILDRLSEDYNKENNTSLIDIRTSIDILRELNPKLLKVLIKSSLSYNNKIMLKTLSSRITEDGSLDIKGLDNPEKLMFIKKPKNLTKKIEILQNLKTDLEQSGSILFQEEASITNEESEAISGKLTLIHAKLWRLRKLIKKVNVLLAEALEDKAILDAEADLSSHKPKYKLDKFMKGVDYSLDSNGNYDQIGDRLVGQADEATERLKAINRQNAENLEKQNIDQEKLEDPNLNPEQVENYINSILKSYDLLSEYPADAEQVANNIKPADNKWRCYRSDKNTFATENQSKVILIPDKKISMKTLMSVVLTHEIIHILQRENTAEIGLPLYTHPDQLGGDRSGLFQEGGAMYYQGEATKKLFDMDTMPWPHYIKAMRVKQAGGDYLACVKAYYESSVSLENEKNLTEAKKLSLLKMAIDRSKRLFRNTPNFNNNDRSIPSTKDTVYLEQKAVVEEIIKHPELQNLILVSGINLETAKEMIHFGLLDLSKLRTPDLSFVQKIWEEEKHKYTLDSSASDSETTQPSTPDQT